MTYRQDAEKVLAAWREVERDLERATPGSPEAERLDAEAGRLRADYQAIVGAAMTDDPEPLDVLTSNGSIRRRGAGAA
jgi:hypothetical protein